MTKGFSGRVRLVSVAAVAALGAAAVLGALGTLGAGLVGAGAGVASAPPSPHPAFMSAERAVASAPRYWTRARMAAARAVPWSGHGAVRAAGSGPGARTLRPPWATGVPWAGGGAVARTTGKVFFTLGGIDYVCSATTVASANSDVVLTAAHCVSDGAGHWATNWTFVPGYANGREPYGSYPARAFFVPAQWTDDADESADVAFVAVNVDSAGQHVVAAVGGQPIEFGRRGATEAVFGYPELFPYDGRKLEYCDGTLSPDPYGLANAGLACALTEGGSGGPWLSGFDPATGLGVISGVTAFRYSGDNVTLYSADLGPVARALYNRAARA